MEIYNDTYCVYVHTNKINGKKYIGQTINGDKPEKRWKRGDGYRTQLFFARAINKYGWDCFEHEVVASNLTKKEADNFESLLINKLKTKDPNYGYNLTDGGEGMSGFCMTDASKEKRRNSMKKYFNNQEYIQRMKDVSPKKEVYQFSPNGDVINFYESTKEAERCTGVHSGSICSCALNKKLSAGGFIWLFKDDISNINSRVEKYRKNKLRIESIVQLTLEGVFIAEWDGSADAGRHTGIEYKNINAVCRGKRNKAGGYKWMYSSDYYDGINIKNKQ